MPAALNIVSTLDEPSEGRGRMVIGRRDRLQAPDVLALLPSDLHDTWIAMVRRADPGDNGRLVGTLHGTTARRFRAGVLPEVCSRHNTPSRSWAIPALVNTGATSGDFDIVLAVDEPAHAFASVCAVARALPTFTANSRKIERSVRVMVLGRNGPIADVASLQHVANGVRYAASLVDRPPNDLTTTAFIAEARAVAARTGAALTVIEGEKALLAEGLGGIWAVGKASEHPPALVVLDHIPSPDMPPGEAWVGKGIVYDTGGLSIKTKTGMPGMKTDMGGAAGVLAAFEAAVNVGMKQRLTAILCIAENSVGPGATRPDDVLKMYSGRTVEVNNTDAEGRLVLADGVAWAARNRSPGRLIDMATLTGSQAVATGKRVAAVFCSDEDLEQRAVRAGRSSGDLCYPIPYFPEFHRGEFGSQVADMKNSVKNRSNAQTSCAAQFIGNHLDAVRFGGPWLHIDMAGPSHHGGRGTGYGVALLLTLAGVGAPVG